MVGQEMTAPLSQNASENAMAISVGTTENVCVGDTSPNHADRGGHGRCTESGGVSHRSLLPWGNRCKLLCILFLHLFYDLQDLCKPLLAPSHLIACSVAALATWFPGNSHYCAG